MASYDVVSIVMSEFILPDPDRRVLALALGAGATRLHVYDFWVRTQEPGAGPRPLMSIDESVL